MTIYAANLLSEAGMAALADRDARLLAAGFWTCTCCGGELAAAGPKPVTQCPHCAGYAPEFWPAVDHLPDGHRRHGRGCGRKH